MNCEQGESPSGLAVGSNNLPFFESAAPLRGDEDEPLMSCLWLAPFKQFFGESAAV